jgi:MFS family permease
MADNGSLPGPVIPAGGDTTRARRRVSLLLLVLCAAQFMDAIDLSVVGVALPSIQRDLRMPNGTLQWVVSAYVVGYGGFLLIGGRTADVLGRRRVLTAAIAVFAAASVLGALAPDAFTLIVARLIKGISAGFTVPAALSIITTSWPEGVQRNRAIAKYGATGAAGFSLGLVLGGLLTGTSWRLVFVLPAPLALLLLAAIPRLIPRDVLTATRRSRIDYAGAMLITGSVLLLIYAVTRAPTLGWTDPRTLGMLGAVALAAASFLLIESRVRQPLVPLRMLRSPRTLAVNLTAGVMFGAYAAFQFIGTLYMQQLRGWTPLETALAFLPLGAGVLLAASQANRVVRRVALRRILVAGLLSLAVAYGIFTRIGPHTSYLTTVLPTMLVVGLGIGILFTTLILAGVQGVAEHDHGLASGLVQTSIQVGGGVLLAVVTAVIGTPHTPAAVLAQYHKGTWVITASCLAALVPVSLSLGTAHRRRGAARLASPPAVHRAQPAQPVLPRSQDAARHPSSPREPE